MNSYNFLESKYSGTLLLTVEERSSLRQDMCSSSHPPGLPVQKRMKEWKSLFSHSLFLRTFFYISSLLYINFFIQKCFSKSYGGWVFFHSKASVLRRTKTFNRIIFVESKMLIIVNGMKIKKIIIEDFLGSSSHSW